MKKLIAICVIILMAASSANAVITVYDNDRPGWETAVAAVYDEEFFTDVTLNPEVSVVSEYPGHVDTTKGVWWDRLVCPASGPTTTTWQFAIPLVGYGGNWNPGVPGGPGANISVKINGSWVSVGEIPSTYMGEFWGFVSTVPFTMVRLEPGSECGAAWCETYELDNMVYSFVPSFVETSSTESSLVETIVSQKASLENVTITGDFNSILDFNSFEIVSIATGPWAGKGFSKGQFQTTLEGINYTGDWQGVLFPNHDEGRIYLKGATSEGISATVEGYLAESVPDSNVYDEYQATWKIGRLDSTTTSATINLNGNLSYQSTSEFPATELYILQTNIEGNLYGDCSGPLSTVINHVAIVDGNNPYDGQGFSIISYVSDSGQGQGWTYNELVSPAIAQLKGLFSSPLFGVVSGMLDESNLPRTLLLTVRRVDIGLPPMANVEIKTWGPSRVSPGQTVNYIIEYRNDGLRNAEDVVVVDRLPHEVEYVSSSEDAVYDELSHEVVWTLESLPARTEDHLRATVRVQWGLPWGSQLSNIALVGTTSDEIDTYQTGIYSICDILRYLLGIDTDKLLDAAEAEEELADPGFAELHSYAEELGYLYTGVTGKLIYSDGSETVFSVMASTDPVENVALVAKFKISGFPNSSLIIEPYETLVLLFDGEGGILYNPETGEIFSFGDSWAEKRIQCLNNCMAGIIPGIGELLSINDCRIAVQSGDPGAVWGCIKGVVGKFAGKAFTPITCLAECLSNPSLHTCEHCTWREFCQSFPVESAMKNHCDQGTWELVPEVKKFCGPDEICVGSSLWDKPKAGAEAHCKKKDEVPNVDSSTQIIAVARDPSVKYGPDGRVSPGEKLDYRVEYENEGEGIAFGVYFTDTLDEDLDDSTLEIGPVIDVNDGSIISGPGTYNPATRTISWFAGEVDPGQGGYSDFSVNVKADANDGTEIINFATIHFPSVPEETRTNGIVSIVTINQPVDEYVSVSMGRVGYDRRTGQFSVNVSVTNISGTIISEPVWLVIEDITNQAVTLANADGTTADGKPYIDLTALLGDGQLEPGEAVSKRIYFNNPSRVRFNFTPSVRGVIMELPEGPE